MLVYWSELMCVELLCTGLMCTGGNWSVLINVVNWSVLINVVNWSVLEILDWFTLNSRWGPSGRELSTGQYGWKSERYRNVHDCIEADS